MHNDVESVSLLLDWNGCHTLIRLKTAQDVDAPSVDSYTQIVPMAAKVLQHSYANWKKSEM